MSDLPQGVTSEDDGAGVTPDEEGCRSSEDCRSPPSLTDQNAKDHAAQARMWLGCGDRT